MRLRRLRFRLRLMMAVVAALGLIPGGETLRRRHERYEWLAAVNAIHARHFREAYETGSSVVFAKHRGRVFTATPALRVKWAQYHETLARKYARGEPSLGDSRATSARAGVRSSVPNLLELSRQRRSRKSKTGNTRSQPLGRASHGISVGHFLGCVKSRLTAAGALRRGRLRKIRSRSQSKMSLRAADFAHTSGPAAEKCASPTTSLNRAEPEVGRPCLLSSRCRSRCAFTKSSNGSR
jgi:hypothetical protein